MSRTDYILTDRQLQDLNPLLAGDEVCAPGHSFGPAVRRYTLIHYVLEGKGIFYARGGVHPVEKGQAFLDTCSAISNMLTETEEWKALPPYETLYE